MKHRYWCALRLIFNNKLSFLFFFAMIFSCGKSSKSSPSNQEKEPDLQYGGTRFSSSSTYGGWSGNGGAGVYCNGSLEVFDLYEGRVLRNIQANLGDPNEAISAKEARLLDRLAKRDKYKASIYKKMLDKFDSENAYISGIKLNELDDLGDTPITAPPDCKIVQIIVQQNPDTSFDYRFIISKDLWDLLDNNSKVALRFHEIIYREIIARDEAMEIDSKFARFFNSLITSDWIINVSQEEYDKVADKFHLRSDSIYDEGTTRLLPGLYHRDEAKNACKALGNIWNVYSSYYWLIDLELYQFVNWGESFANDNRFWGEDSENGDSICAQTWGEATQLCSAAASPDEKLRVMCVKPTGRSEVNNENDF